MGQAAGTADTAAHAGHPLDEVVGEHVLRRTEQGRTALLDAVARDGAVFEGFVQPTLDERLPNRVGQAAAAGENASEIGGVVQNRFRQ